VDRAGILFFGRIFEMCHEAFEELMMRLGGGIDRAFAEGFGMPLVHAEADFDKPIKLGDRLDVELSIERLGGTSIAFGYRVLGEDGEVRARARLVHVFIALPEMKARPAPDWVLEGLRTLGLLQ
jgi:1,4-dihydroxy-2-naphthoyl-CoA hydrolase